MELNRDIQEMRESLDKMKVSLYELTSLARSDKEIVSLLDDKTLSKYKQHLDDNYKELTNELEDIRVIITDEIHRRNNKKV
jgi:hypothetical protein